MSYIKSPQAMNEAFAAAYNSGDVENFMPLYEDTAVLGRLDGTLAVGVKQIRQELTNLLKVGGSMKSTNAFTIINGAIALLRANWSITTVNSQRKPQVISGSSLEIVRQQDDGSWRYTIDHPLGTARAD